MSNPFSHDATSNAATDYSFAEDQGVPNHHLVSFAEAMDAPRDSLSEQDYRFPDARTGGDEPVTDQSEPTPVEPWRTPASPRPGYYPKGYAP